MSEAKDECYRTDVEVEEVVKRFESGALSRAEFKHRPHLTVALWYQLRLPYAEALAHMRRSILIFVEHHGIDRGVYHETLTAFWMRRVRAFLDAAGAARTLTELANELLRECGDSRLVFRYFSKELIDSEEARRAWVEPDLRPLDF
jgi:hypothetical protein